MGTENVKAGDWLIIRSRNLEIRQVDKVTPTLFKLGAGSSRYPTQISRGHRKIVCSAPDEATAGRLRNGIAGIDGEFGQRQKAADEERSSRVAVAEEARQKAIAKLLAETVL